jgi:hypothetical protein
MSFREKSAWITLLTVLLCFGVYFGAIITGRVSAEGLAGLHLLLVCVAVLVVLQSALNQVASGMAPKDSRAPADEREIAIQHRARSLGYYVLMGFSLALFLPVHFGHSAIQIANFALLGVVLTTLAVSGAEIAMFRRGF